MPVAKVMRLPPVSMGEADRGGVGDDRAHPFSTGMPSTSAAIIAMEAREPPMSGLPVTTVDACRPRDVHRRR